MFHHVITRGPHKGEVRGFAWAGMCAVNRDCKIPPVRKYNTDVYKRQDEFHLLLKEEQTAAYSVEIWKRFRKWGGIPTGITQNVKDLLASREVENIFENSDFVYLRCV